MAHISIKNLSIEFKVFGSTSMSIKKEILSQVTGGKILQYQDNSVSVKALDNLNLEISDGDKIGLVGHNGAGKSTLLRVLAGIYMPTSGSINIEGSVGSLISPSAGMDQESTGIENIYFRGYLLGMSKAEIDEKLDDIVEFTELGNFLHLPVRTYSAGMFTRLAFAISTSIEPEILLIDEVVGAGDPEFHEKAQERLKQFKERAKILIFASHSKQLVSMYCDKVFQLEKGRVIPV